MIETEKNTTSDEWSVFSADYKLGENPIQSCRDVLHDVTSHSWQIWMIFKSNFTATFRETALGAVWGIILPLIPLGAFLFLSMLRVFPTDRLIHPMTYIIVGISLWLLIQGFIMAPIAAIEKYREVLKSSDFPTIGIIVSSYGQLLFDLLVRLFILVPVLLHYSGIPPIKALLVPLYMLPMVGLSMAIGMLLGLGFIWLRDIKNLAEIGFRYLVFISLAIFPLPQEGIGWWLYTLNPFAIFIDNIRSVLVLGELSHPIHYWILSSLSVLAILIAGYMFNILESRARGNL